MDSYTKKFIAIAIALGVILLPIGLVRSSGIVMGFGIGALLAGFVAIPLLWRLGFGPGGHDRRWL